MFDRLLMFLIDPPKFVETRWKLKLIAIKLKLYEPDEHELECIKHNKNIRRK